MFLCLFFTTDCEISDDSMKSKLEQENVDYSSTMQGEIELQHIISIVNQHK